MNVSDLGEDVKQYKLKLIYIILFFVIIGLVIYSQVITAKLFFDDEYYIVRNLYVHDFNYAGKIFTSGATNGAGFITTYYRPMQFLSYLIIYSMFKTNPMPYHLFSIFLHIGISILIYLILNHLNYSTTVSIFSSLLFLVHPLSTQAVSYVSGSGDVIGLFFVMFSLYIYIREDYFYDKRLLQYFLVLFSLLISLFSKERSAVFLGLFLIFNLFLFNDKKSTFLKIAYYFTSIISTIFYLWVTKYFIGAFQELNTSVSLPTTIITFLYAFYEYIKLIFYPVILFSERPYELFYVFFEWRIILSAFIFILLLFISIYLYLNYDSKVFIFSFFWFILALLPSSGIFPLPYTLKEHWIYYSFVGFCIGFAYYYFAFFERFKIKKKIAITIFIIIILLLSIRTYSRNVEWSNPKLFWANELEHNPNSENAIANLAYEYYFEGNIDDAIILYQKGIEVTKTSQLAMMYYNLGYMYSLKGKLELSIPLYKKALEIDPNYIYALDELIKYYSAINDKANYNKYYFRRLELQNKLFN